MTDLRRLIDASDYFVVEKIHVFGVDCFIREWTIVERESFESLYNDLKSIDMFLAVAVRSLCDEKGKRLYADDETKLLRDKSVADLTRLFHAALQLNRLRSDDVEDEKKSSGEIAATSSSVASPKNSAKRSPK